MAGRLEGKVAVVTGGASGLGLACAQRFAGEGAAVALVDLVEADAVEAARGCAGDAIGLAGDVGDPDAMASMAAAVLERFGRVDVVHANAGIPGEGSVHELEPAAWERVLRVNLTGVYLTVRSLLPSMMRRRSGSLILTASVGGLAGLPSLASYAASKGGVIALARQLAVDYAPHRIRANAICPATVPTPLVRRAYEERGGDIEAQLASRAGDVPLGRLGEPSDVANLALFLASDESSWITGGAHVVDGGTTAAMVPRSRPLPT